MHPSSNLKEIKTFLQANPLEVIAIFIEGYAPSHWGLTKLFNAAGLTKYRCLVSRMPKNGGGWPLLRNMISKNQRLPVFTSKSAKEDSREQPLSGDRWECGSETGFLPTARRVACYENHAVVFNKSFSPFQAVPPCSWPEESNREYVNNQGSLSTSTSSKLPITH